MRLNRLDLNLLVALDALLTERSITRAAEKIHLSQPATSGALARLREFFGDEILVRVGAQMTPTPLGESLAAPVQNILLQIKSMVDRGLDFEPEHSDRKFRILCSDYTAATVINPLVEKLAIVAPKLQLDLVMPNGAPKESLEQGEVDFLIMPVHLISDDHPSITLFEESFVCIGDQKNPAFTPHISEEAFLELGHVSVKFGSQRQLSQDQLLLESQFGIRPRVEIVTSTFSAIPPMLVNTNRIATCYDNLARNWAKLLPLQISPMPYELPSVVWHMQWHKYRELDPGILWLRDQLSQITNGRPNNHTEFN